MLMTKCTLNSEIVFTTFMILSIVEYSCMDRLTSAVENLSHMLNMLRRIEEFLLIVPPQQRYSVNSGTPRNDNGRPVTLIQAGSLELAESDTTNPEEDSLPIPPPPSRRHSSISLYDVSCNEITASRHFSGLTNVTFYCRQGEMIAITGRSGSGKTTVLQSIAGELPLVQGQIFANGKIAYVAQKPWIFKGTLRENIVFGESFNESRYAKVMEACALTPDVDDLICGDLTVIGTPGIVLSAGQRARISLARAVYSEAEIYLLDEPLACMGSHIADYIFSNCILGMLSSHVCILATKREKYLQQASRILLLMNGVIVRDGSYQSLVDSGEDLVWLKSGNDADDDDERERSDMTAYDILEEEMQTEDPLAVRVTPRVYFRYLTAGAHFLILLLLGGTLLLLPGGELCLPMEMGVGGEGELCFPLACIFIRVFIHFFPSLLPSFSHLPFFRLSAHPPTCLSIRLSLSPFLPSFLSSFLPPFLPPILPSFFPSFLPAHTSYLFDYPSLSLPPSFFPSFSLTFFSCHSNSNRPWLLVCLDINPST